MSAAFNLVNFTMSGIQLKITMHQKNKKTGTPTFFFLREGDNLLLKIYFLFNSY